MRKVKLSHALIGCFLTSSAYAVALNTQKGRYVALYHTWATVVAGVGLVLGWTATQEKHSTATDLAMFAAGGIPMIARSLLLDYQYTAEHNTYRKQRRG
jgi:hypothetical protein